MYKLQLYSASKLVFNNNAYTLSATYYNRNLNMYATYITLLGLRGSPKYHTTQIRSFSLNNTKERYLEGATYL